MSNLDNLSWLKRIPPQSLSPLESCIYGLWSLLRDWNGWAFFVMPVRQPEDVWSFQLFMLMLSKDHLRSRPLWIGFWSRCFLPCLHSLRNGCIWASWMTLMESSLFRLTLRLRMISSGLRNIHLILCWSLVLWISHLLRRSCWQVNLSILWGDVAMWMIGFWALSL